MSRWFRVYDELLDDPKVQRLPAADFKGWMNLLCLASKNNGKLPSVSDTAFALRETEESVSSLFHRLQIAGLLEDRKGVLSPYKWAERQYKSDTSTERVKRFRQRSRNADETPPEAETDTETDTPPNPRKRGEPKKAVSIQVPEWMPVELWLAFVALRERMAKESRGKIIWSEDAAKGVIAKIDRLRREGHCPAKLLDKAVVSSWRTVFEDDDTKAGFAGGGKQSPIEFRNYCIRQAELCDKMQRRDDAAEWRRKAQQTQQAA